MSSEGSTVRVAVLGATGRMGRRVVALAASEPDVTVVAAVGRGGIGAGCFADAEVVVDFSLPAGLAAALPHLGDAALVTGTTGLDEETLARLADRSARAPVLTTANFSTGVTLLLDLVERAARVLPEYDVEVIETHHRAKVDAPSGTALALARAAAGGRGTDLGIGIHAVRMGDVVGEHQVWLAGAGERVLLGHVATSRDTFAAGALRAARWIRGRPPGRYAMRDALGMSCD